MERTPIPLNEKDLCAETLLIELSDPECYLYTTRNDKTRNYFIIDDSLWCMEYRCNDTTIVLEPIDFHKVTHVDQVIEAFERIVRDYNNCNTAKDCIRTVGYEWTGLPKKQLHVTFYDIPK